MFGYGEVYVWMLAKVEGGGGGREQIKMSPLYTSSASNRKLFSRQH